MTTLLVDSNYICHRALHTTGDLEFEEIKTGVVFGVLRQIRTICEEFKTNKTIFCWDSRQSKRKDIYPDYKSNRNDTSKLTDAEKKDLKLRRKLAFAQFTELRKTILPSIGFKNQHIQKGYEADDLIAKIVKKRKDNFVMITADEDMYQLLSHADMYKPQSQKYVRKEDFQQEFNILPSEWARVKAIAGCSSDHIKGVSGVGDKTAAKFISGSLKYHTKTYKNIVAAEEMANKNLELVQLPLDGTKCFKLKEDSFNLDYFYSMCTRFGMTALLKESHKWKKLFEGDF